MKKEVSGFRILQFEKNPVFLWIAEISEYHSISKWIETLDVSEISRYHNFKFAHDAQNFAAHRFFARLCLNSIGCFDLNNNSFQFSDYGKPFLKNSECHFSWASSKNHIALAASQKFPVGIDIECIDKDFDIEHLWSKVSGNDDCDKDHENFFRFWTAREAIAKLTGTGLNEDILNLKLQLSKSHQRISIKCPNNISIRQFKTAGFIISIAHHSP